MKYLINRAWLGTLLIVMFFACSMGISALPVHALSTQGNVWDWGYGYYGQLGQGTYLNSATPTQLDTIGSVSSLAGGCYHSLALKPDGTVWAWGDNGWGELGIGSDVNTDVPTQISSLTDVKAIAAGCYNSMAVKADGTVWTWGNNGLHNLGIGDAPAPDTCRGFNSSGSGASCAKTPVQVVNLTDVKAVATFIYMNLALKNDGTVWAWGYEYGGTPVQVPGLANVTSIATGGDFAIASEADGTVWAWGTNAYNLLVDTTASSSLTPVQITELNNVKMVSTGYWTAMALKSDGTVWAWGRNIEGEVGNGTTSTSITTPTQVVDLSDVKMVANGLFTSFALKTDGTVAAWGYNWDAELGIGTYSANSPTPVMANMNNVTSIAPGSYHVLVTVQNNQPPTVSANGPYYVPEGGSVTLTATGSDPENGPLTYAWDLDNNGTFETTGQSVTFSAANLTAPSSQIVRVQVTDDGGLTTVDQATVYITYNFTGFFQPINNLPTLNAVNAGRAIPVKFSLGGDKGLNIIAEGYPVSQQIACDSSAPTSDIEATTTAGSSSLTYDPTADQYIYVWSTDGTWAGTCRQLTVKLADGTVHQADFEFK